MILKIPRLSYLISCPQGYNHDTIHIENFGLIASWNNSLFYIFFRVLFIGLKKNTLSIRKMILEKSELPYKKGVSSS